MSRDCDNHLKASFSHRENQVHQGNSLQHKNSRMTQCQLKQMNQRENP